MTEQTQVLRCPCCLHHQQDEDKCPGGEKGHGDFIPTPSGHSPSLRLGKAGGELTNIADMGNIFGTQGNMVDILK